MNLVLRDKNEDRFAEARGGFAGAVGSDVVGETPTLSLIVPTSRKQRTESVRSQNSNLQGTQGRSDRWSLWRNRVGSGGAIE